jgi:hypothetical protein
MRSTRRRLEHGKASIETLGDVDFGARKCHANASVGWQTDVVDDDPQGVSVGCRDRTRQTRDCGEDQPECRRETCRFVQK